MDASVFRFIWRNSRREQLLVLGLILLSLPFYFLSLDVPKRIVNDAIQQRAFEGGKQTARLFEWTLRLPDALGGGNLTLSPGLVLEPFGYLFALSMFFLVLVLINGWFKYLINVRKGVLGERMLELLRFELFSWLMRFRPEDIRAAKPAEVASMIKDEVEPVGAFAGDAFIQPVFLGAQALTALTFILLQNMWLGLIALAIVLVQALVIPRLRREQIRLGRERQIASRQLAGGIGAIVEAAPTVHGLGATGFMRAGIGRQLRRLYDIRVRLFKRKFAVKYLNNLLAQVTPFFFFAVGGYFALRGQLDIGQLVAVIAAYRDLPPPIKELIDWDQQRTDVDVKYQQIIAQFAGNTALPVVPIAEPPLADTPIALDGLRVADRHGTVLLDPLTLALPRPSHIALVGPASSGRDALARVLGRQVTDFQGTVRIGSVDLGAASHETASRFLTYSGSDPGLLPGSIRDNLLLALRRPAERDDLDSLATSGAAETWADDWLDVGAGPEREHALEARLIVALRLTRLLDDVYRLGLLGRLKPGTKADTMQRVVAARHSVRAELAQQDLLRLVEPFDPERYNGNATIGENLLFGIALTDELAEAALAGHPYVARVLRETGLHDPLVRIGRKIAEQTLEMFSGLPSGHPLFERYSFIRAEEFDLYRKIVETFDTLGDAAWAETDYDRRLISLAFTYIEGRHRFNLLSPALMAAIVVARERFRDGLPTSLRGAIEFYDPDQFLHAAPVRDNLLFGRAAFGLPDTEQQIADVLKTTLIEIGLDDRIYDLGLDHEVGPGGRLLFEPQRAALGLARALVKRPQILIVDGALSAFGAKDGAAILADVRAAMRRATVIATFSDPDDAAGFDHVLRFDGRRLAGHDTRAETLAAQ